jgi:hypothetical protein
MKRLIPFLIGFTLLVWLLAWMCSRPPEMQEILFDDIPAQTNSWAGERPTMVKRRRSLWLSGEISAPVGPFVGFWLPHFAIQPVFSPSVCGLCGRMCGRVPAEFHIVRRVSGKRVRNGRSAENPIKTALKPSSQGRKLVAGAGFEPTTFRL